LARLEQDAFPYIGRRAITTVTPLNLVAIEKREPPRHSGRAQEEGRLD
jgi:hypothetical protein